MFQTPLHEEVSEQYNPSKEPILVHEYNKDLAIRILKNSIIEHTKYR